MEEIPRKIWLGITESELGHLCYLQDSKTKPTETFMCIILFVQVYICYLK